MAHAHSTNEAGQRHDLVAHLRAVAQTARTFAESFGGGDAAYYAGLWHDLGKFHPDFQAYLHACDEGRAPPRGPDHKAAGSVLAKRHGAGLLPLLIQGHHGGLTSPEQFEAWLGEHQRADRIETALTLAEEALPAISGATQITLPGHIAHNSLAAEMFLRMLFSALVDADFLDTEHHFDADRSHARGSDIRLATLLERLEQAQQALLADAPKNPVNEARAAIYQACVEAADRPPGIFRLTVPTGGGKTRSAMAFALRHALLHGQQRVVVVVPFITITEQTAGVYRAIFEEDGGTPVVLEHHSGITGETADDESGDFRNVPVWSRLAAENWDAPIIVTTTVRLFESLFARSPSQTRRLHRLANSVIILDEAQALPSHVLRPALDVLRQLAAHYGTTVVLSTATQPAFGVIPTFAEVQASEIVPEPARWFDSLRRVEYEWRLHPPISWAEAASLLRSERQELAVVNTKKDAFALLDALDDREALHLSTTLCGAHRSAVIAEIRRRLKNGEPCHVISTQVVEAGVDIDFPMVLRALGPLDSVIQAAGRCNREGNLERGRVVVFQPAEGGLPLGAYRAAVGTTRAVLGAGIDHPDDTQVLQTYFERLFASVDTDRERIQNLRSSFNYLEVARRFRLIDDDTEPVVITAYGTDDERRRVRGWVEQLHAPGAQARRLLRVLQPYIVSLRRREAERYRRRGLIGEPLPGGVSEWYGRYDPVRGLIADGPDPDALVV